MWIHSNLRQSIFWFTHSFKVCLYLRLDCRYMDLKQYYNHLNPHSFILIRNKVLKHFVYVTWRCPDKCPRGKLPSPWLGLVFGLGLGLGLVLGGHFSLGNQHQGFKRVEQVVRKSRLHDIVRRTLTNKATMLMLKSFFSLIAHVSVAIDSTNVTDIAA